MYIPSFKSRGVQACGNKVVLLSYSQLECTMTTASILAYWRLNKSEMTQLHIQRLDTIDFACSNDDKFAVKAIPYSPIATWLSETLLMMQWPTEKATTKPFNMLPAASAQSHRHPI